MKNSVKKKIKKEMRLSLPEYIYYLWENRESVLDYRVVCRKYDDLGVGWVSINNDNQIVIKDVSNDSRFVVNGEFEITQDTEFETLVSTYPPLGYSDDSFVDVYTNQTINGIISEDKMIGVETERIYALIEGKLELIWEREE